MDTTRNRLTSSTLALLLAAGALAGCAQPDDADAGPTDVPTTPSAETTSPPSSEPAPTPSDDDGDIADPGTWAIEDGEIGPLEIGEDYDETLAELPEESWTVAEGCEWVASYSAPDDSYMVWFARESEAAQGPVTTISVDWGVDQADGVGPRTEDGALGVGSTRDEVLAVFPDAEEVGSAVDVRSFLRISDDDADDGALFFEYADGQDGAQSVALTTSEEPPYEVCA